jgi:hypothetical protein
MSESAEASPLVAIMNGGVCDGFIIGRGARGVEAFDKDENSLGVFPDTPGAATVVKKSVAPDSSVRILGIDPDISVPFDATSINYLANAYLNYACGNRERAKQLAEQVTLQVITRIDEKYKCDHCKRPFSREVRRGPMLKDEVWLQLAAKYETLCGACVVERAAACGAPITFADLLPCAFNLMGGAHSWFKVFGDENDSECEKWNEARRELQRQPLHRQSRQDVARVTPTPTAQLAPPRTQRGRYDRA